MGISASQARLLSITSRMNDVEYKSQQISNTKVRLADEAEQVANAYTKALNKTKLTFSTYDKDHGSMKVDLNSNNLANLKTIDENGNSVQRFRLIKADGSNQEVALYDAKTNPFGAKFTESQLYEMLESGKYMLQEYTTKTDATGIQKRGYFDTSTSSNTQLAIEADQTELAKAEAEYNAKTLKINNKEKLLDNDLKALDTEHNALKTEQESIKSLIKENVDKTFNLFS